MRFGGGFGAGERLREGEQHEHHRDEHRPFAREDAEVGDGGEHEDEHADVHERERHVGLCSQPSGDREEPSPRQQDQQAEDRTLERRRDLLEPARLEQERADQHGDDRDSDSRSVTAGYRRSERRRALLRLVRRLREHGVEVGDPGATDELCVRPTRNVPTTINRTSPVTFATLLGVTPGLVTRRPIASATTNPTSTMNITWGRTRPRPWNRAA